MIEVNLLYSPLKVEIEADVVIDIVDAAIEVEVI